MYVTGGTAPKDVFFFLLDSLYMMTIFSKLFQLLREVGTARREVCMYVISLEISIETRVLWRCAYCGWHRRDKSSTERSRRDPPFLHPADGKAG